MAYFGLALFEQVLVFAGSGAGLLGAGIFVTAGIYQLTPFKDVCLKHCRSPMSLLTHYTSFSGLAVDLRVRRLISHIDAIREETQQCPRPRRLTKQMLSAVGATR